MSASRGLSGSSPSTWQAFGWAWSLIALAGCGSTAATGGTEGVFRYAGRPMSDVQITVYHQSVAGTFEPVGFAVPAIDGSFQLYQPAAVGPLWLLPGSYRLTLESAGAPIEIPPDYTSPETTPLRVDWSQNDRLLDIEMPANTASR